MPQLQSGKKHVRADEKKRVQNHSVKSELRTTVKKFKQLLIDGKSDEAKGLLSSVYAQFDKAAKKNVIHSGNAKRSKSRLAHLLAKTTQA